MPEIIFYLLSSVPDEGERVKDTTSPVEQLTVLREDVTERKWRGRRESSEGGLSMDRLLSFCIQPWRGCFHFWSQQLGSRWLALSGSRAGGAGKRGPFHTKREMRGEWEGQRRRVLVFSLHVIPGKSHSRKGAGSHKPTIQAGTTRWLVARLVQQQRQFLAET